ncbi:class I SAM-dependent methyltransferase [Fischerella sp. PCC 9605]|uniref:class I SAM-dependent methyltransferase n=1 Tax=Fischerella sp. PCC 9605 TaxID=1173024 RepID=UPI00047BC741|nr:class I SAM-dependent methyltransferase [Fischerella sp. PCC 9605]
MTVCAICNHSLGNKSYFVREMMFGFRDEFEYFECGQCGCLQLKNIPENISKYYPDDFYSFQIPVVEEENTLQSFLRHQRMKYLIAGNTYLEPLLSKILTKISGIPQPIYYDWVKKLKLPMDSKILDVGCGVGKSLLSMRSDGFTDLTGIDPFIEKDIFYENGVKIFKKHLDEMEGQFDFIFLNHSFEHMPNPLAVIKKLYSLLKSDKHIIISIPLASSFAWRKYGIHWVQIDAPRHFFVHTIKSMEILANQGGFQIADVEFNSNCFQFWGSEQFLRDIPLIDSISYAVNPENSIFSKNEIKSFAKKSTQLNKEKDGDQASFYLYKP